MQQEQIPVKNEDLDAFHWHEALDRTFVCMDMVDRLLLSHPAIGRSESLRGKVEKAHQLLCELYQEIGGLDLSKSGGK